MRKSPADTKAFVGCAPGPVVEIPLQPVERPLVEQAVPLQTMGLMADQICTLKPVEKPPVEQMEVAWRRLRPMESPRRSRPRAGAAAHGEEPVVE